MKKNKKILLIGGSGQLGSMLVSSKLFKKIYFPSKKKLNILNNKKIRKILTTGKFQIIINCAALARMRECENNISKAIDVNVSGTLNLVKEIIKYNKSNKKNLRLIHISTDAVYPSQKGGYSEKSPLGPYNVYGWTKLASEFLVKMIDNHVILRTRFFNKENIKFHKSAKDLFSSSIEIKELVKNIKIISESNFTGTINVGAKRKSDYANYKKFKSSLKPCFRKDIVKSLKFNLGKDSSMNLKLLKKIVKRK